MHAGITLHFRFCRSLTGRALVPAGFVEPSRLMFLQSCSTILELRQGLERGFLKPDFLKLLRTPWLLLRMPTSRLASVKWNSTCLSQRFSCRTDLSLERRGNNNLSTGPSWMQARCKSELVRRAVTAFLQTTEDGLEASMPLSAVDLVADLVGCCDGGPADLSSNPDDLASFGEPCSAAATPITAGPSGSSAFCLRHC